MEFLLSGRRSAGIREPEPQGFLMIRKVGLDIEASAHCESRISPHSTKHPECTGQSK